LRHSQGKNKEIKHSVKKRERCEEEIKKRKHDQGKFVRELSSLDKRIQEKETELNKKRPMYIKVCV